MAKAPTPPKPADAPAAEPTTPAPAERVYPATGGSFTVDRDGKLVPADKKEA